MLWHLDGSGKQHCLHRCKRRRPTLSRHNPTTSQSHFVANIVVVVFSTSFLYSQRGLLNISIRHIGTCSKRWFLFLWIMMCLLFPTRFPALAMSLRSESNASTTTGNIFKLPSSLTRNVALFIPTSSRQSLQVTTYTMGLMGTTTCVCYSLFLQMQLIKKFHSIATVVFRTSGQAEQSSRSQQIIRNSQPHYTINLFALWTTEQRKT